MTAAVRPRLFADFNRPGLPDCLADAGINFSRGGTAWMRNASGIYVSCPVNLITTSNPISIGGSAYSGVAITLGTSTNSDPFGGNTATSWLETASTALHYVGATVSVNVGYFYTVSVYAKLYNTRRLQIAGGGLDANSEAPIFDLSTGTVYKASTSNCCKAAGMTAIGGGWYRCWVTAFSFATTVFRFNTTNSTTNFGSTTIAGSTTDGLYLYGGMVDAGNVLNPYIGTSGAVASQYLADYDPVAGKYACMLEQTETNYFLGSTNGTGGWGAGGTIVLANTGNGCFSGYGPAKATAAAVGDYMYQTIGTQWQQYIASVIIEAGTTTASDLAMFNSSGTVLFRVRLTHSTGVVTVVNAPTATSYQYGAILLNGTGPNGGKLYMLYMSAVTSSSSTNFTFRVYPDPINGTGICYQHHAHFSGANSAFLLKPSSPIVTGSLNVTRAFSVLRTGPSLPVWQTSTPMTIMVEAQLFGAVGAGSNNYLFSVYDSTGFNYVDGYFTNSGLTLEEVATGGNQDKRVASISLSDTTYYKVAYSINITGSVYFGACNGTTVARTAGTGTTTYAMAAIEIGGKFGASTSRASARITRFLLMPFAYSQQSASGTMGGLTDLTTGA